MNRRDLMKRLFLAGSAPSAMMVAAAAPIERPHEQVSPICPRCGCYLLWGRKPEGVGDFVPVSCGCGFQGKTLVNRPIPEWACR